VKGVVVWFTGRPASGKSTFAERVRTEALSRDWPACLLDGDAIRAALVPKPGYDPEARDDFYATLANLAALLAGQGLLVLVPATAHRQAFRERARAAAPDFLEVWVNVPEETVRARDPKGLYAASGAGQVDQLPGVDLAYEEPTRPDIVANGGRDDVALRALVELLASRPQ
jgi:adenylylsulfate kinase